MSKATYTIYSTAGKYEVLPASATAVLGEYVEVSGNHGRKVYKKQTTGRQQTQVLLYFWDARDGPELCGWWIGDKVGGGQVWSRCPGSNPHPPKTGWKCPVDGPVQKHVVCEPTTYPEEADDMDEGEDAHEEAGEDAEVGVEVSEPIRKRRREADAPVAKRRQALVAPRQTFVFASKEGDQAPQSVKRLLGDYVQQETQNHGKKTYMKKACSGEEPMWLYYWDQRDGWDFTGWWIGSQIGGALVFARAQQHNPTPAARGWKVPHDGAVKPELTLLPKPFEEDDEMPDDVRLQKATEMVRRLEADGQKSVETSKKVLDHEDVLEEGIRATFQLLCSKATEVEEAKLAIVRHTKASTGTPETDAELSLLDERLQSVLGNITKVLDRAEEKLRVVEQTLAEERDSRAIEKGLPVAMELTMQAEMAAENVGTQEAAEKAEEILDRARAKVVGMLRSARRFAPEAQKVAVTEFSSLRERCDEAAKRLAYWADSGEVSAVTRGAADESWAKELAGGDKDDEGLLAGVEEDEVDTTIPETDRLERLGERVVDLEVGSKHALETAEEVLRDGSDGAGIELSVNLLREKRLTAARVKKAIRKEMAAPGRRVASGGRVAAESLRAFVPRVEALAVRLSKELTRAKEQAAKALHIARKKDHQEQNAPIERVEDASGASGEALAEAAVERAEEAVEVAAAEASDLDWRKTQMETGTDNSDEFSREVRNSMDQTQAAADKAQEAIATARAKVDAQIRKAKNMDSEESKSAALTAIAPLRSRLVNAQRRLNPFKQVRQDFDRQLRAKRELKGIFVKLVSLDNDVERLKKKLAEPLCTEEDVAAAETSVAMLQKSILGGVGLLLPHKEKAASDGVNVEFQAQVTQAHKRLQAARHAVDELRVGARDQRANLGARLLASEAQAEAAGAEEWLKRIAKVESPWDGKEVLPEAQATPALDAATKLVAEAEEPVKTARVSLTERLVEAKRVPEGPLRLQTIDAVQLSLAKVDAVSLKVTQLKIDTFARKAKMAFPEAIEALVEAEALVAKVAKAAADLDQDNLETVTAAALKKACDAALVPTKVAEVACDKAKKALESKQRDPKYWGSPSFHTQLTNLTNRLDAAIAKVAGVKQAARDAAANKTKTFKAQKDGLAVIEEKVAAVELLTLPLGDERPTDQNEESTAKAVQEAQDALSVWMREAERFKTDPHGAMRLAMQRVIADASSLAGRLKDVRESTREQRERALCRAYVKEGTEKVREVEAALATSDAAEGPFLKGIEVLDTDLAARTVIACEESAIAAKKVIDGARTWFLGKSAEVAAFQSRDEGQVNQLKALQKKVMDGTHKLAQFCNDTERRKKFGARANGEPARKAARLG